MRSPYRTGDGSMHSSDRTLLAKLGFSDPDRRDSRHDLACQYLALPDTSLKLAERFLTPLIHSKNQRVESEFCRGDLRFRLTALGVPAYEVHVSKGSGQYQTTIGFLDLVIPFVFQQTFCGQEKRHSYVSRDAWVDEKSVIECNGQMVFEIKVNPVGIGDLLRQLRVYREYYCSEHFYWICVTAYPVSRSDVDVLRSSGIYHIRLGADFEAWASKRLSRSDNLEESRDSILI